MKLISFVIPSYNSERYLNHAVDTILAGGEEVEIIIVNDGSTDATANIADRYASEYPSIVKAIHKENGGHGSGVNCGVKNATGVYFKVVDSDDWVDSEALKLLLDTVRSHLNAGNAPDLYITNFVYDHAEDDTQFVRQFRRQLPANRFFQWSDTKRFYGSQLLLMHALMYKTQIIRDSDTVLPEHTFYVDNLFAFKPLPFCKTMYYCDLDLYHYFIGRADQSVNIHNLTRRYAQQMRVTKCMYDAYSYTQILNMDKRLRQYMLHMLGCVCMNAMMFCCSGGDDASRRKAYSDLWQHTIEKDCALHRFLRTKGLPLHVCWMPWKFRGWFMLTGYKVLCKINKLG